MPSQRHEALVTLFRNDPALAPGLLQSRLDLPAHTEVRIESADLGELQPVEYRGDLVVVLRNEGQPVLGVIVEIQLRRDDRKRMSWPAYAINLRQRLGCDTCVLVISPDERIARWADKPIRLGAGSVFYPLSLGPASVPKVLDPEHALREPELAVLSAMAHGRGNTELAIQIALTAAGASKRLDADRAALYFDLVIASLGPAARQELLRMDMKKYKFQSDFAKHYIGVGRAEGRAATLHRLLDFKKLGPLDAETQARIERATPDELETWAVRVVDATSLSDVFGA